MLMLNIILLLFLKCNSLDKIHQLFILKPALFINKRRYLMAYFSALPLKRAIKYDEFCYDGKALTEEHLQIERQSKVVVSAHRGQEFW
jgi:hypothetical protein